MLLRANNQNADQWKTLILDTFEGVGLEKTSRRISVNIETAFNMRHRIMCMMEKELENEVLSGEVELDETFVESSRKSLAAEEDAGFGVVAERVKKQYEVTSDLQSRGFGNTMV